jgi:phage terminase large subunit-like protein
MVHHVGYFDELEEQMTSFLPGVTVGTDRLDAVVWGITDVMGQMAGSGVSVF